MAGKIGLSIAIIILLIRVFNFTILMIFCPNHNYFWIEMLYLTMFSQLLFFFLFLYLVGKDMESNYDSQTIGNDEN